MNSLGKKDIDHILLDVSSKLKVSYESMQSLWCDCVARHLEKQGVKLKSYNGNRSETKCQHEGCGKKVIKPTIIDDKVLCSVHLKQYVKEQKRNKVSKCQHIFVSTSEAGQQCSSFAQCGSKFCKRHQKKFEL